MGRPKEFDPDAVLDKAVELFWTQGYETTSVQDLVDHLEVHRSALYRTFGDKHALYLAALKRYCAYSLKTQETLLRSASSAKSGIRRVFEWTVERLTESEMRRGCFAANATVECTSADTDIKHVAATSLNRLEEMMRQAVEQAQAEGDVPAHRDAMQLARSLVGSLYGLRVVSKTGQPKDALYDTARGALSILD